MLPGKPLPVPPRRAHTWIDAALGLLFPPRCLLCAAILSPGPGKPFCLSCRDQVPAAGPFCPRCEAFYPAGTPRCSCSPAVFPGLYALSWYEGEWRRLLHRLKYGGRRNLAPPMGRWLGEQVASLGWPVDLVTAVPLHSLRLSSRGYNQSWLLAGAAARALGRPAVRLLERMRETPSQTGLSREERRRNVAGAFAAAAVAPLPPGRAVLLVDDIYTTGSTFRSAASVLASRGLAVYGAVLAFQRHIYGDGP